jgi:hypothetical protein
VYWRRRLLLLGSLAVLIVLLALTVRTVTSHDGQPAGAAGTHSSSPLDTTPVPSTSYPHTSSSPPPTSPPTSSSASGSGSSSSATPLPCDWHKLAVSAVSAKSSWHVGDEPVLELQVTNVGRQPCVQDLADSQVVLNVYNGESRVWGSHDCEVQPGTDDRTLAVNMPVNVAIMWSGLSSQPNCAGTRQRVGAGTYTLYAALSGHTGKAAQFTIS